MTRREGRRASRSAEHAPPHDRWLLSYADFVTLLLAVFIVLFALSRDEKRSIKAVSASIHSGFDDLGVGASSESAGTPQHGVSSPERKPPGQHAPLPFSPNELKSQLEDVLGDAIDKHEIMVQQTSEGLIVSLKDFGFFNSGEAELLPGAAAPLQRTAHVLMKHNLEVRVEGHSDDQPIHTASFRSNWELSTARATSVLTLLTDEAGFPAANISVAGYGPYRPVADNLTTEGRRMNRRVDLVIVEPKHNVVSANLTP